MNTKKKWPLAYRIFALLMAVLITVSVLPVEGVFVLAEEAMETAEEDEQISEAVSENVYEDVYAEDGSLLSAEEFAISIASAEHDNNVVPTEEGTSNASFFTDGLQISTFEATSGTNEEAKELTVMFTALNGIYNTNDQKLVKVEVVGEGELTSVLYSTSGDDWSDKCPTEKDAGSYPVYVKAYDNSGNEYLSNKLTATIAEAELGINVETNTLTYTGVEQALVKLSGDLPEGATYQWIVGEESYSTTDVNDVPKATDAGTYIVTLKVEGVANYKNFEKSFEVTVGKALHSVQFVKEDYRDGFYNETELNKNLKKGKEYDFSVSVLDETTTGEITYSSEVAFGDSNAKINESGKIVLKATCLVKINAVVGETANYKETTISCYLNVKGTKSENGELINLTGLDSNNSVSYVVSDDSFPVVAASPENSDDKGGINFEVIDSNTNGLKVDKKVDSSKNETKAIVSVADYSKLLGAITATEKNELIVYIKVTKDSYFPTDWKNIWDKYLGNDYVFFDSDEKAYSIKISLADIPASAIAVYSSNDFDTPLTSQNGLNQWYNTSLVVEPTVGYQIIREDMLPGINQGEPNFLDKVKYAENNADQGEYDRYVYLKETTTGKITQRCNTYIRKVDTVEPSKPSISLSKEIISNNDGKFYQNQVEVTFKATDTTSGVNSYAWTYKRAEDASITNLDTLSGTVTNAGIKKVDGEYVATISLPASEVENKQLRGTLVVTAIDAAGNKSSSNESDYFIVDSLSPRCNVEFGLKNSADYDSLDYDDVYYSSGTVSVTVTVTEENFYKEDVAIYVAKDGATAQQVTGLTWISNKDITGAEARLKLDEHQTTFDISGDGSYEVYIEYTDKSQNTMPTYKLERTIIIDSVAPECVVSFNNPENETKTKDYHNQIVKADFEITEINFFDNDVKAGLVKDGTATELALTWTKDTNKPNTWRASYELPATGNDGDYQFTLDYMDRSGNTMTPYVSRTKVIDTTAPVMNVTYSDTEVINTLKDREGFDRKYYNAEVVATVTITERNFDAKKAELKVITKDVTGTDLPEDSGLYTISAWKTDGDVHTLTVTCPGDANYSFDVDCEDLATNKASDYAEDHFTVDTTKPENLEISYSKSILDTIIEGISFGFYNAPATATVSAYDNISGVNSFNYSLVVANGVSSVNASALNQTVDAAQIKMSDDGATGTVSFEIPKGALSEKNQFNGTVTISAKDRSGNESDNLNDRKRIVVDNIAPTSSVSYNAPVQVSNGIAYYDGDINATVTINEANFYSEDVKITVVKDGAETGVTANWSGRDTDVNTGTFTITGDGDYQVKVNYTDKSSNQMVEYVSDKMVIDTIIEEATINVNGAPADGRAFKDEVVPSVSFTDKNFETYEIKLTRTTFENKNVDVTSKFVGGRISTNEEGGSGSFDTFDKILENDGIYTMTVTVKDKAGHSIDNSATFTVNRFGSVYEYNDYLVSIIANGGAYLKAIEEDLVITEYNADQLVSNSLNIEISKDGKPIKECQYSVTPDISDSVGKGSSGWFQYTYTIAKENFAADGVYKIAISSADKTGNNPENTNYADKVILFRVDSTCPEITSVTGLEKAVANATAQKVKYTVYDTIGLQSVTAYIDGKEVDVVSEFVEDANNYSGSFVINEDSSAQAVRLVVVDLAGNVTDTAAEDFSPLYKFNQIITVSTNFFVRWFANKALFISSVVGIGICFAGVGTTSVKVVKVRKKNK